MGKSVSPLTPLLCLELEVPAYATVEGAWRSALYKHASGGCLSACRTD
jgi:hypothetical protein